jgi:hypothetical protein
VTSWALLEYQILMGPVEIDAVVAFTATGPHALRPRIRVVDARAMANGDLVTG